MYLLWRLTTGALGCLSNVKNVKIENKKKNENKRLSRICELSGMLLPEMRKRGNFLFYILTDVSVAF